VILILGFQTASFASFMQNKFIFHPYTLQDSTRIVARRVVLSKSLWKRKGKTKVCVVRNYKFQPFHLRALADRNSPTRPGRSIKMGLYLYINLKFNRPNTLFSSWGDRAVARYGPQDGPPVLESMILGS
jgi:hypothetical protein